jgi:hypothetical protein
VAEDLPIGGDQAYWQYHPDTTVDIAATMIGLNARHFDHLTLPLEKRTKPDDVGCGQRVHIIGLFRLHRGQKRNVPIVHTGHIAALPDPSEKIAVMDRATGEPVGAESYLVEAQTLEGLSGSPVFVQGYVAWRGQATYEDTVLHTPIAAFGEVKLLGVYQAAWDGQRGTILEADRDFKGKLRVPVGMGIVVPIEKVIELIEENSNLKQWRQQRKEAERAGRATP